MKKSSKNDTCSKNEQTSQEHQKKNIVVSILLSESTTSELKLDLPNIECMQGETSIQETDLKSSSYNLNKVFENDYVKEINGTNCEAVSSEVAYFSSHVRLNESWSSLELEHLKDDGSVYSKDVCSNTSSYDKLKPSKIYTRPLLSVRSAAHKDCIKSQSNNIYVTVVSSQGHVSNSDWINVCRICHGGESIGNLLSPCQCKGSIALAHIQCLERWLKESATSHCELCRYHYTIVRQPKYGILKSILVFLRHPGDRLWEMICDLIGFTIYTSATIVSTYTLSVLCESISKTTDARYVSSQIMGFTAVLGIAIIDFAYTSWLLTNLEKHTIAWQTWYRNNCDLKVILSDDKQSLKCRDDDSIITEQE
ncbi:hypothetical protein RN001_012138 [Aquatica leii]|uniref:RING-CH-type domain-containing protein n=1 Tax=Aquatica leii TaxID=1421715 RepID=A0AAN7S7N0_9COLE|nr:hypothetical protein RN001_012138 [Aquatica leii]